MKNYRYPIFLLSMAGMLLSCTPSVTSADSEGEDSGDSHAPSSSQISGGGGTSTTSKTEATSKTPLPAIDYVKIMVPAQYDRVWAWTRSGGTDTNLFSTWPGDALKNYDDTWKTYDFTGRTSLWVIVSTGGNGQTGDFELTSAGYWWLVNGAWNNSDTEPDSGSGGGGSHVDVDVPTGDHTLVKEAATYKDLPVFKDPNVDWTCVNAYNGTRTDFRDESIYFAITTRFYDGDSSNNARCWDGSKNPASDPEWRGDFKGLIEKMDYIKAQGFTAIWITPIVENASGYDYHGYHALNFKKVDHRYESEDVSFQTVINEAHKRDMKIVLDVVFNHTGNFGEENLFPMFYKYEEDTTINGMLRQDNDLLPANYASLPGGQQYAARIQAMKDFRAQGGKDDEYIYHHEKNMSYEQYIEQTGQMAGDCVDLNTENPTVANYLVEAYGQFIHMGVDAFRIDTMKHISRLTFNNYLWPAFQEYARKCGNKYFFMFGEVCTRVREVWNHGTPADSCPFYTWKESKSYPWGKTDTNLASTEQNWNDNSSTSGQPTSSNATLNGLEYHTPDHSKWSGTSVIDFPMHRNFQYASAAYDVAVNNDHYYNDATYNVVYVDSHDYGPEIGSNDTTRYPEGEAAWKENMSLMFTFRGVPCVYYGSEIQFKAGVEIDVGTTKPLESTGRAYFGDHLEGNVTANGFGSYTASGAVKTTLESNLSKHLQKLNQIRLQVPALRRGQYKSFGNMKFVRRYKNGSTDSIAAVAISGGCTFTGLPNGTYKDLYGGGTTSVTNGTLNANASGQGNVQIWVKQ